MEDVTADKLSDNKFQPTSGYERETKVKIETETDHPPKKKKKVMKEPVHTAVKAAMLAISTAVELVNGNKDASVARGTKGHELVAGQKLPHGDNVSDGRQSADGRQSTDGKGDRR